MARTPMLRVLMGLIVGILICENLPVPPWAAVAALSISLAAILLTWRRHHRIYTLALYTLFIALGLLVSLLHQPHDPFPHSVPQRFIVQIADIPQRTAKCYKATTEAVAFKDAAGWHNTQGSILLYIRQDSCSATLQHGDMIIVQAQPHKPDSALNPYQFDYRRHLRHKGILYQCYVPSQRWQRLPAPPPKGLSYNAKQTQLRLLQRLRSTPLTPEHQGLVAAIALGYRDDLQPSTQLRFQQSGITHLLCVSGLHVGIVALLVGSLLFFLGRKPWQRLVKSSLLLLAVWSFALISGLAPATLRAALMFSLFIISENLGRQHSAANNLCTSAVILLLANPSLIFDVGFQLSYAAMTGILLWHKPLQQLLPIYNNDGRPTIARRILHKIWSWAALSLSAQLATLPLILYYFHQFPTLFLVANLLIVPFMEILLAACFLALLFGGPMAELLQAMLRIIDEITGWVAAQPHALLDNLYCDRPLALLLALLLILLTILIRRRKPWALPAALLCVLLATAYTTILNSQAQRQHQTILYQAGGRLAVECLDGRHSYLVCDSATARNPAEISYQRDGLIINRHITSTTILPIDTTFNDGRCAIKSRCILFCGRRLLVIDSTNAPAFRQGGCASPISTHFDAVVVAPRTWVDSGRVKELISYDTLLYGYGCTSF